MIERRELKHDLGEVLMRPVTRSDVEEAGEHWSSLPFMDKASILDQLPHVLSTKNRFLQEWVTTSGTTDTPLLIPLTETDIERLRENERRSLVNSGVRADDRALIFVTLDMAFMAGLAYYEGLRAIGAETMRLGASALHQAPALMSQLNPTVLIGVPSFFIRLSQELENSKVSVDRPRVLICIGESLLNEDLSPGRLYKKLKASWPGSVIVSSWGNTELQSSVSWCYQSAERMLNGGPGPGGHVHEDLLHIEILDDMGNPVREGEVGELVATPLRVEGLPLRRFRTGDMIRHVEGPCCCGYKGPLLGPVVGRKRRRLKIKGTSIEPDGLQMFLTHRLGVENFVIVIDTVKGHDHLQLLIDKDSDLEFRRFQSVVRSYLRVTPEIELVSGEAIEAWRQRFPSRKKQFILDMRR